MPGGRGDLFLLFIEVGGLVIHCSNYQERQKHSSLCC